MAGLRAAVLAAGRGVRMGGKTAKTLLPVGSHQPLLHYILEGLRSAGVEDLLVVTGYDPKPVQEFVVEKWGDNATFIRNPRYASWGNFHSLRLAIDQSPGMDLLVVNSDIVVARDVYARVAGTRGDLVLSVERRMRLDEEDMRVELDGDRVRAIGKTLKMGRSHGEFTGVSLLRPDASRAFADVASDLEWRAETDVYYEDVYARILPAVDARAAFVSAGEYAEVDEPADVEDAVGVIEEHWSDAPVPS